MTTPGNSLNIKETGFQSFDGVSVFKGRTLTAGTGISISNGTGVSGDPVFSVSGSTVGQTITGDSGGALSPTAGNWNILSTATAGGSTSFSGSGSTLSLNLTDIPGANTTLGLNAGNSITVGNTNTSLGQSSLQNLTEGAANVAIGAQSMVSAVDSYRNIAIGVNALTGGISITDNVAVGHVAGAALTGIQNVLVGSFAGDAITSGSYNIAFGYDSASAYTSSESSNILVGNSGTISESNTIRIGTQGSGNGQQNRNFQAGIASVITSNSEMVTIDTTTGQLGSTTIPAGTVTSVSGTADRITSTGGATPVIDIAATYVGQTSITTLGTIATGTWNGTTIDETYGGTNQTTYATGDILYASGVNTLSKLSAGSNDDVLTLAGGVPTWAPPAAPSGAIYASGTLTSAQFKALNTSPLTIAAAPGAGSHYVVVSAGFSLNYGGTNAFTSGGSLQFQVNGTSVVSFASTGYTGTVSSQSFGVPNNVTAGSFDNGVLRLIAASSDPGGNAANDNTVDWYCLYVLA